MLVAVGDIHGHRDRLTNLLARLPLQPTDRMVFIGDYIDRGPDTPGVIDDLIALSQARPNTVFLRGNHEQMMLECRADYDNDWAAQNQIAPDPMHYWKTEGAGQTVYAYRQRYGQGTWYETIPREHWTFFLSTQMEFREGSYLFVHAGIVPPGFAWREPVDPRLWIRKEFIQYRGDLGAIVVYGHTPIEEGRPRIGANKVGIDTACAYGGPLTAVGLPEPYDVESVAVWQG